MQIPVHVVVVLKQADGRTDGRTDCRTDIYGVPVCVTSMQIMNRRYSNKFADIKNSVVLVRKRNIQTERPQLSAK
jgi:hypothetical protein